VYVQNWFYSHSFTGREKNQPSHDPALASCQTNGRGALVLAFARVLQSAWWLVLHDAAEVFGVGRGAGRQAGRG
jgi:hypothetical protein